MVMGCFCVVLDNSDGFFDMSDLVDDMSVSLDESVVGLDDVVGMGEAVLAHDRVQSVDHLVRMSGGVSDDRVQLVDKSVVSNDGVHLILVHLHAAS